MDHLAKREEDQNRAKERVTLDYYIQCGQKPDNLMLMLAMSVRCVNRQLFVSKYYMKLTGLEVLEDLSPLI